MVENAAKNCDARMHRRDVKDIGIKGIKSNRGSVLLF